MAKKPARREARGPMWRNRIVGHGAEAPSQLLANPWNWRIHTIEQQNLVEELLETIGWVQQVVVNRRTGHMVDGHMRVVLAMRREEETVPITYVDVTPEEEQLILATLDPSGALAVADDGKLGEVLAELPNDMRALADVLHAERQAVKRTVAFEAKQTFRVVVDCGTARKQGQLLRRLTGEGWDCHAG